MCVAGWVFRHIYMCVYVFASVRAIACVEYVYTCVVSACICLCCVRTYIHVMNIPSLCKLDGKWDLSLERLGMRPGPDPKGLFRVRLRIRTPQKNSGTDRLRVRLRIRSHRTVYIIRISTETCVVCSRV